MINIRLREERRATKLNQPDFAKAAGVSKRTVIDWEKGITSPTVVQLAKLAKIDVDIVYVLTGLKVDEDTRQKIAAMLETTARVDPDGDTELTAKAIIAVGETASAMKRNRLHALLAECPDEDLPMVEQLLERLSKK